MLEEEKDTALEEGKTEVEENQAEPSSLEDTVDVPKSGIHDLQSSSFFLKEKEYLASCCSLLLV